MSTQTILTQDEYLVWERQQQDRHLYLDGEVFAMAGESVHHAYISVNLVSLIHGQLRGKKCSAFTKDMKVRSGSVDHGKSRRQMAGMFSYPDVVVVCDEPEFHDHFQDVVTNPKAIFEIFSESTEAFDRGEKFARLQKWNPTLTDYVLVSQDKPQFEHFAKADEDWSYRRVEGSKKSITIESIGCKLKLGEVYERVKFAKEG